MSSTTGTARYGAWIRNGIVVAGLGALLVAPAGAATPPDAWITMKTKLALFTTENVHATGVDVDTVNGRVTLHGKVRSTAEKEQAEAAARKIDGVKEVRNLLQVVTPPHEKAVKQSDKDIEKHVNGALKNAPALKDSSITVQSVNNGVVLLSGKANTLGDHLAAVELASNVPGVRRVASEVQSPDAFADAEIYRQGTAAAPHAKYTMGDSARDMWVTSATKMRLLADGKTPAMEINVDTRNGVVTLFGIVPTTEAKRAAAADARKVSGVRQVKNELQVVPKAKEETVKARDDDLQREVKQAFENREDLKNITVEVKNCVARLSGNVPTGMQRLEAAVVARSTHGVCAVQDDLHVAD